MFMKPQIEHGSWHICDTNNGLCVVPADLCAGNLVDVLLYCDATVVYEVETKEGYGARLSAPGYMDCTDWTFFLELGEAGTYLLDLVEDDEEDEEDEEEVRDYLQSVWNLEEVK